MQHLRTLVRRIAREPEERDLPFVEGERDRLRDSPARFASKRSRPSMASVSAREGATAMEPNSASSSNLSISRATSGSSSTISAFMPVHQLGGSRPGPRLLNLRGGCLQLPDHPFGRIVRLRRSRQRKLRQADHHRAVGAPASGRGHGRAALLGPAKPLVVPADKFTRPVGPDHAPVGPPLPGAQPGGLLGQPQPFLRSLKGRLGLPAVGHVEVEPAIRQRTSLGVALHSTRSWIQRPPRTECLIRNSCT